MTFCTIDAIRNDKQIHSQMFMNTSNKRFMYILPQALLGKLDVQQKKDAQMKQYEIS